MFNLDVHVYSLPMRAARYNACGIRFRLGLRPAMIEPTEKPSAHIEVAPARPEQESIMANLLELYAHDFSEFHDLEIGAEGSATSGFRFIGVSLADIRFWSGWEANWRAWLW
jgi:hypothetical protein